MGEKSLRGETASEVHAVCLISFDLGARIIAVFSNLRLERRKAKGRTISYEVI